MKKRISGVLALILAATLVLSITGCGNKTNSNQSSEQQSNYHNPDIEAKDLLYDLEMIDFQGMVENKDVDPVYTDFAVKLAQASDQKDANLLVSPMSVMYGLMLPASKHLHAQPLSVLHNGGRVSQGFRQVCDR